MDARPSLFIIQNNRGEYLCPICGFAGYFRGNHFADDEGGVIGSGICPCCFYEPGFDDNPLASAEAKDTLLESIQSYRKAWIEQGMPWRGKAGRPAGWEPASQLARLLKTAPFLSVP
jgi:hypothetical protein